MEKVRYQLLLTIDNYDYLREQQILCRHKNLSETINLTIRNYKFIIRKIDQETKQNNVKEDQLIKEKEKSIAYREQIINKKPMDPLDQWFKKQKTLKPYKDDLKIEKKKKRSKKDVVLSKKA